MLFAAPAVAVITVFFLVPLGLTFYMSLNEWSLLGAHSWIGFENYTQAVKDPAFREAFVFTLEYTAIITPILLALGHGSRAAGPAPAPRARASSSRSTSCPSSSASRPAASSSSTSGSRASGRCST